MHILGRFTVIAAAVIAGAAGSLIANASTSAVHSAPAHCAHPRFVTSATEGGWGDGHYYVTNNMWNSSGYRVSQRMYVCSPQDWYIVATMDNARHDGAVKTYPNVHEDFGGRPVSSFRSITSTFAETSPHTGIYEDAYDIWVNGVASSHSTEVMVWNDNWHQVPAGTVAGKVTLGGRTYQVWRDRKSRGYIAFVATHRFTSGTVNLLQMFRWLIGKGWLPAHTTLGQIDYGAELVSTVNVPRIFTFTNFTITTS